MDWNKKKTRLFVIASKAKQSSARKVLDCFALLAMTAFISACSFSYSFQGGKLNYDVVKTITIHEFPDRMQKNPSLAQTFDLALRKRFVEQTRLVPVPNNGDIEIEGEITGYDFQGTAATTDPSSNRVLDSNTRLTVTIHVKYTNNKEANSDVDQTLSSQQEFPATLSIEDGAAHVLPTIVDELVDKLYNATVANW
jgi:hypothetical protein